MPQARKCSQALQVWQVHKINNKWNSILNFIISQTHYCQQIHQQCCAPTWPSLVPSFHPTCAHQCLDSHWATSFAALHLQVSTYELVLCLIWTRMRGGLAQAKLKWGTWNVSDYSCARCEFLWWVCGGKVNGRTSTSGIMHSCTQEDTPRAVSAMPGTDLWALCSCPNAHHAFSPDAKLCQVNVMSMLWALGQKVCPLIGSCVAGRSPMDTSPPRIEKRESEAAVAVGRAKGGRGRHTVGNN